MPVNNNSVGLGGVVPIGRTLIDESKKLKNMSLVLNGVDYTKNSRYGYGKYGYGKYGYGKYGYGSYGNTNSSENAGGEASNYQVVKIGNLKDKRMD